MNSSVPYLSTFSIVARDPKTGELAVAGATHWYGYGRFVPHLVAGAGAIATQASTNVRYAHYGIKMLEDGLTASQTLKSVMKRDPDDDGVYQLIVMDAKGRAAAHTGKNNHFYASHIVERNLAVAGNTLYDDQVVPAIAESYKKATTLPFGLRLIRALQAGQAAGGDIRGKRSAALKIVSGVSRGFWWEDIRADVRVDDQKEPLIELERLYRVSESFGHLNNNDYHRALEAYPENAEALFGLAMSYEKLGDTEHAEETKKQLVEQYGGNWNEHWNRVKKRKT